MNQSNKLTQKMNQRSTLLLSELALVPTRCAGRYTQASARRCYLNKRGSPTSAVKRHADMTAFGQP